MLLPDGLGTLLGDADEPLQRGLGLRLRRRRLESVNGLLHLRQGVGRVNGVGGRMPIGLHLLRRVDFLLLLLRGENRTRQSGRVSGDERARQPRGRRSPETHKGLRLLSVLGKLFAVLAAACQQALFKALSRHLVAGARREEVSGIAAKAT